jgi:L-asparaginase
MKRILFLTTGGTIASENVDGNGLAPSIQGSELLNFIPKIPKGCEVSVVQLFNIDSPSIEPNIHWTAVADYIKQVIKEFDGFVVTHGTDTLAFASAAFSYLLGNIGKPVILTGSQLPINKQGTDAVDNVYGAIVCAMEPSLDGVYLFFKRKLIVGTRARKLHSTAYDAFESINYPTIGFFDGKRLLIQHQVSPKSKVTLPVKSFSNSIISLRLLPGLNSSILELMSNIYDIIVLEIFGVGGLPFSESDNYVERIEKLSGKGTIFVLTTQTVYGGVDLDIYSLGVSEKKQDLPYIEAYDMNFEAVITKMMLINGTTHDTSRTKELFYTKVWDDLIANNQ